MSRLTQEAKNEAVADLDPKHERRDERRSDAEQREALEALVELAAETLEKVRKDATEEIQELRKENEELRRASPLTPQWLGYVTRARKTLARARGYDRDHFDMTEVPGLLKAHGVFALGLLEYPPFAAAFGCYVIHADPAEVKRTFRSLYKEYLRWQRPFFRARRAEEATTRGKRSPSLRARRGSLFRQSGSGLPI
jgi:hypothetical protein